MGCVYDESNIKIWSANNNNTFPQGRSSIRLRNCSHKWPLAANLSFRNNKRFFLIFERRKLLFCILSEKKSWRNKESTNKRKKEQYVQLIITGSFSKRHQDVPISLLVSHQDEICIVTPAASRAQPQHVRSLSPPVSDRTTSSATDNLPISSVCGSHHNEASRWGDSFSPVATLEAWLSCPCESLGHQKCLLKSQQFPSSGRVDQSHTCGDGVCVSVCSFTLIRVSVPREERRCRV